MILLNEHSATMDTIQIIVWVGGIIFGIITANNAIRNFKLSIIGRQEEQRWKKANLARELITEIHEHPKASVGVLMLDWFTIHMKPFEKGDFVIQFDEVLKLLPTVSDYTDAAKAKGMEVDSKEFYILDCMD
jgi:hypothetical protein